MKLQRGQTMIEFALMLPFMALFIFGMIYGGAMFMEYLDFSNQARQIARDIAVLDSEDKRAALIDSYKETAKFTRFYNMERTIHFVDENDNIVEPSEGYNVRVMVTFTRENKDLPNILKWVGFPPETINPIVYYMKLEKKTYDS